MPFLLFIHSRSFDMLQKATYYVVIPNKSGKIVADEGRSTVDMDNTKNTLKEYRKKNRLSQKCVAEHLGVSRYVYTQMENGHRKVTAEDIIKMSDLYQVSADSLLHAIKTNHDQSDELDDAGRGDSNFVYQQENRNVFGSIEAPSQATSEIIKHQDGISEALKTVQQVASKMSNIASAVNNMSIPVTTVSDALKEQCVVADSIAKAMAHTIDVYKRNNIDIKSIADKITESYHSSLFESLKKISLEFNNSAYKNILMNLSKIDFPKIQLPPDTLESLRKCSFLVLYHKAGWPLFFIDNEELRKGMEPFLRDKEPDDEQFKIAVIDYFDKNGVGFIYNRWAGSDSLDHDRLQILFEAITLYNNGFYYGSVSIIMCQIMGIIKDIYAELSSNGKTFDADTIEYMYESYNNGKEIDKTTRNKIKKNKVDKEKYQLLCIASDISTGILYWGAATEYLYRIVLTSDSGMEQSNHSCRNKICHGEQLNYGDKEHALKAILSVDIVIHLADLMHRSNNLL